MGLPYCVLRRPAQLSDPQGLLPWTPWAPAFPHLTSPYPVHPSKVSDTEKSQLVNETRWQYYGTTGARGNLSLTWNASALPTSSVTIELWGYEETGEALCRLPLQGLVGSEALDLQR